MERKTARLTLLIDPRKKKLFEEVCAGQDLTPSQVVRKMIREYLVEHTDTTSRPAWLAERRPKAPRNAQMMRFGPLDLALAAILLWLVIGIAGVAMPRGTALHRAHPLSGQRDRVPRRRGRRSVGARRAARGRGAGDRLADLPFHLRLDALSAFFLAMLGLAGAAISLFSAGYFRASEGTPPGLLCLQYHVFLASMALVLLADDAYAFMVRGRRWRCRRSSSSPPTTASPRSAAPASSTC